MSKSDKIHARTVTPGKQGVNISREKYEVIHDAILAALTGVDWLEFRELPKAVEKRLKKPFDGNVSWYTTTVKLDMERRRIIERIPGVTPQRLRLKQ